LPTLEHEVAHLIFKVEDPTGERVSTLADTLAAILGLQPPRYKRARLWDSKTTVPAVELIAEKAVLLCDADDKALRTLVIEIQQDARESKRRSWPVYGWAAWRETGVESVVVVIAFDDAVATWAQKTIVNGSHTFNVQVIGRHNLPVITDQNLANANPLLALLSAIVHLQSPAPPKDSSQTQEDKDRESAAQLKIADTVAHEVGLPEARLYVSVLLNHLTAEAQKMAREDAGPILTIIEREAQEQVHAAAEKAHAARGQAKALRDTVVDMTVKGYKVRYEQEHGPLPPEEQKHIQTLLLRLELEALMKLGGQVAAANTFEQAKTAINSLSQETDDSTDTGNGKS
jgi:hypothetical protein